MGRLIWEHKLAGFLVPVGGIVLSGEPDPLRDKVSGAASRLKRLTLVWVSVIYRFRPLTFSN